LDRSILAKKKPGDEFMFVARSQELTANYGRS
jgi:hypothetical protein